MVIIIPTKRYLRVKGKPYVKDFPGPKKRSYDQEPYTTFQIHHDVEGLVKVVHFTGPTVKQYPFLEVANELLEKLELTTIFSNPDDVFDEDYQYLKEKRDILNAEFLKEVAMQPAARKKAQEALRLVNDEIARLTPQPVQRFRVQR